MEVRQRDVVVELISVIIPAHNARAFIADTLASAQAQTYENLEIIVVDDGSTDDTATIVEAIAARDLRIRLLHQQNQGVASARNFAIRESRSTLIAPLDADDLWHPEKIARQYSAMRERGRTVGMVYAWSSLIDEEGLVIRQHGGVPVHEGDIFPFLIISNLIGSGSVPLLRRDYVLEVGGYDTSLRARGCEGCEDLMLYLTIAARHDVALVPEFLIGYRKSAFKMSRNVDQMKRSHDLVIRTIRARYPELPRRVFRWAQAMYCWRVGGRLYRSRPLSSCLLCARTFAYDPGFLFEPQLWRSVGRSLRRLLRRVGLTNYEHERRVKFIETCARSDEPLGLKARLFSRRRNAYLAAQKYATRDRRPPAQQRLNDMGGRTANR